MGSQQAIDNQPTDLSLLPVMANRCQYCLKQCEGVYLSYIGPWQELYLFLLSKNVFSLSKTVSMQYGGWVWRLNRIYLDDNLKITHYII